MAKIHFPPFRQGGFSAEEMRQFVSAVELRFQQLESNPDSHIPTVESGDDGGEFAPLNHTHVEADITDLAHTTSIFALLDVDDVTPPFAGQGLIWDGVKFIAGDVGGGGGGVSVLNDLADVNAPGPADQNVLLWDAGSLRWIASALPPDASPDTLVDLLDTDLTGQLAGDILYNADNTEWQPSGSNFRWEPTNERLQLGNDHAINWLDSGFSSIELLIMDPLGGTVSGGATIGDVSTIVYDSTSTPGDFLAEDGCSCLSWDGAYIFVGSNSDRRIRRYPLGTNWDITTAGAADQTSGQLNGSGNLVEIQWSDDGMTLFYCMANTPQETIRSQNVGTAYDISGVDDNDDTTTASLDDTVGFDFSDDGTKMVTCETTGDILTYTLSTAFDLSTATVNPGAPFNNASEVFTGIGAAPDGKKFYVLRGGAGGQAQVWQVSMSTAWDHSTANWDNISMLVNTTETSSNSLQLDITRGEMTIFTYGDVAVNDTIVEKYTFPTVGAFEGEGFVVGDPGYLTRIDGTQTNVRSATFNVDGATELRNTLDVTGISSFDSTIYQQERSAAAGDIAGDGQWWVRNDDPNVPMFTDDAGNDWQLNSGFYPITQEEIDNGVDTDVTDQSYRPGYIERYGADNLGVSDSSTAIQAAVDSGYPVRSFFGTFLVNTQIEINRPCVVEFPIGVFQGWDGRNPALDFDPYATARFISTSGSSTFNMFRITVEQVYIDGGLYDMQGISSHTGAVFWIDVIMNGTGAGGNGDYGGWGGKIVNWFALGEFADLPPSGIGTTGVFVDFETSTTNNAYVTHWEFQGIGRGLRHCFRSNRTNQGSTGQWGNNCRIDMDGSFCKQVVKMESLNNCDVVFRHQSAEVFDDWDEAESTGGCEIHTAGNFIYGKFFDLGKAPVSGVYFNTRSYDLRGNDNYIQNDERSDINDRNMLGKPDETFRGRLFNQRGWVPHRGQNIAESYHISHLHNALYRLIWLPGANPTWTAYDGTAVDQDTNVTDAVYANASGSSVDITSAGGNLPTLQVGEKFTVTNHSDVENNGKFTITATITDGYTVTREFGWEPVNAASEAIDVNVSYDGRTQDSTTEGIATSSDITISNTDDFLDYNSGLGTSMAWNATSEADEDYVELVISGTSQELAKLYIAVTNTNGISMTKLHVIHRGSSGGTIVDNQLIDVHPVAQNEAQTRVFEFDMDASSGPDEIIIRFIGSVDYTQGALRVLDICGVPTDHSTSQLNPVLLRQGGQMYGTVTYKGDGVGIEFERTANNQGVQMLANGGHVDVSASSGTGGMRMDTFLRMNDDNDLQLGTGGDVQIHHASADNNTYIDVSNNRDVFVRGGTGGTAHTIMELNSNDTNSYVSLYNAGTEIANTQNGVFGVIDGNSLLISDSDNNASIDIMHDDFHVLNTVTNTTDVRWSGVGGNYRFWDGNLVVDQRANTSSNIQIGASDSTARGDNQDARVQFYAENSGTFYGLELALLNNSFAIQGTGDNDATIVRDEIDWQFRSGVYVRIYDSTNADFVEMDHDGTDFDFDFTGTTDWDVLGLTGEMFVDADLRVSGDFTVSGTLTSINTSDLSIADNIIVLNNDAVDPPSENAGIEVYRGGVVNDVDLRWNETSDRWEFTNDGTTWQNIFVAGDSIVLTDPIALTDDPVATPPTAPQTGLFGGYEIWDSDQTDQLALFGYDNNINLRIKSFVREAFFQVRGTQTDGTEVTLMSADPDGISSMFYNGDQTLEVNENDVSVVSNTDVAGDPKSFNYRRSSGATDAQMRIIASQWRFISQVHGMPIQFRLEDNSGVEQQLMVLEPDAGNSLNGLGSNTLIFGTRSSPDRATVFNGFEFRIQDSGNSDYAAFSHDGTDFNTDFTNTTNWNLTGLTSFVLPTGGSPTAPTLSFGDTDTGFYESGDDSLRVSIGGTYRFLWGGNQFAGENTSAGVLLNEVASTTNPTFSPNRSDLDTGIGAGDDDNLSIIAGANEVQRVMEQTEVATLFDPNETDDITDASTTAAAATLTKAGEDFSTTVEYGDMVEVYGGTTTADYGIYNILEVTSNTVLTTDYSFTGTNSDVDFRIYRGPRFVDDTFYSKDIAMAANSEWRMQSTFYDSTRYYDWVITEDATSGYIELFAQEQFTVHSGQFGNVDTLTSAGSTPPDDGDGHWSIYAFSDFGDVNSLGYIGYITSDTYLILGRVHGVPISFWAEDDAGTERNLLFLDPDTRQALIPELSNDAATPIFAFGDGDTGLYESADDVLQVSIAGTNEWEITGDHVQSQTTGGGYVQNAASTATDPGHAFNGDEDTGIGTNGADQLSLIAGAHEAVRYTEVSDDIIVAHSSNVGLTADVGSAQGNGVITSSINVYSTVANAGDAATLPSTFAVGTKIYIKNDGANSMDVFPASGDDAGAGTNNAVAVANGDFAVFIATVADSTWTKIMGGTA